MPASSDGIAVRTCGSSHKCGLDVMQLEMALALRNGVQRPARMKALAFAITHFTLRQLVGTQK